MKRILCLIFTALTLISLTIPAFADTTTFDDLPALDMDNTSIEYDFEHVFLDDYSLSDYYPNSLKSDVELITMAEKGFGIKSKNLFDVSQALNISNWIYVGGSWSLSLNLEVGKEYTISVDKIKSVVGVLVLCRKDDMSNWAYDTVIRFEPEKVGNKLISFKADGRECLWIYRNSPAANAELITELFTSGVRVMLLDGIYTSDTLPPYEPYSYYGLYFYLYNPGMLNIVKDSENNLVQFGSNVTGGIKTDPRYKKHQLKLVDTYGATEESDTHTNALVLKFSLLNYDDFIFLEEFTSRFYDVSGVELVTNENSNATEYGVAQVFEFYKVNGFPTCSIEKTEVLRIDNLAFSFYRVKSEVSNVYKDLHSVSFSIPNTIINKYGEINALHAVWEECLTQPVLIANDANVVNEFKKVLNSSDLSELKYTFLYDISFCNSGGLSEDFKIWPVTANYYFNPNISIVGKDISQWHEISTKVQYNNLIEKLYFAFYAKDVFNPNSVCVTSEQMMAKLNEYKWSDEIFTSIDKTNFDLENPTLYDVTMMDELGIYRVPSFWEGITLGGFRNVLTDHKKYDNIETIDIKDKELVENVFAEDYLVFEDDVEKIQDLMSTDSTTYILHYTATDYITHEAFIYDAESDEPVCNAIVGQATAIRNFDFIDMYFKKGDVVTCLAIGGDPQNFAPALTGHEKTLPGDRWAEFLEFLEKCLGIAIIFTIITIALRIYSMTRKTKVKVVLKERKRKE